jgi:cytochrome b6-f complex iron-sulfur subunit
MPDENAEETTPAPRPTAAKAGAETAVTKAAPGGGALAAAGAGAAAVVVVRPAPAGMQMPQVSRRKLLLVGFWAGMGAMLLGIVTTTINSLYPRNVSGFGQSFFVGTVDQLKSAPGQKLHNLDAKAWLVMLTGDQVRRNPGAQEGSIVAIYHKCVHLGCTVPWRADFSREDPRNKETYAGWFLCPCHGSTYSDAGVRVFGPAPRSLDVFELSVKDGKMTVNTGKIITGTENNAARAILPG